MLFADGATGPARRFIPPGSEAAIVKRYGAVAEPGPGTGVLDDPVTGILWLVHRLAFDGQGVSAGDVVVSGSAVRRIEAPPGSRLLADFGAFAPVTGG